MDDSSLLESGCFDQYVMMEAPHLDNVLRPEPAPVADEEMHLKAPIT